MGNPFTGPTPRLVVGVGDTQAFIRRLGAVDPRMVNAGVALALVLALVVPVGTAQAAPTQDTPLDWTEGSFEVGLKGAGKALIPEAVDAPDHERLSVPVDPCHRELSLGLTYEPRNASARVAEEGYAAEATLPYRFQAGLIAPNGTVLHRIVVDEPDPSIAFGTVEEPGEHTLELELLEGATVDWRVRIRGFAAADEPTCDLWLNEVETNPAAGGDWVELYNEGSTPVDVSGWSLQAEEGSADRTLAEGTVLAAGERRPIDLGPTTLSPADETVTWLGPRGSVFETTPSLTDADADDRTWQKAGDGLGDWIFADGTPGQPNAG